MERAQKKVESRNFDIRKTLIKFDDVMNDQRQVIFSQRLRVLKGEDISKILNDFFEDILKSLENTINDYKKSNDEKYLTEIKNITGNSIADTDLVKLASKNQNDFTKEMKIYLYLNKDQELNF